jgi:hypothetical protein
MMFGSSTPALQKLVVRLVSQCVSSSGCERNWSTFALLHTKVRNRLTHKKLNNLVYVNYNLHLRLKDVSTPSRDVTSAMADDSSVAGQTWQDYKAELLRVQGLNVMSTAEYQMATQMGVFPFLQH